MVLQYCCNYTYLLHPNALGSTLMTTDQTGAVRRQQLYYPWGQAWQYYGDWFEVRFAGLDFPGLQGNDVAAHRDYNQTLGRWLMPDPAGRAAASPANPQSWNMYAYVGDNPTSVTDPSGLVWVDVGNCSYDQEPYGAVSDGIYTPSGRRVGGGSQTLWHITARVCSGILDGDLVAPAVALDTTPQYRISNEMLVATLERQLKEEQCAGQAIKKNGVALGLDAAGVGAGFLPGGDAVVAGVQVAASTGGMMYSSAHYDSPGTALNAGAFAITAITPTAKAIGGDVARAVPVLGAVFGLYGLYRDVRHTYDSYESCMKGHS